MNNPEGMNKIIGCDNPRRRADIVFVHGLDGDALKTWHPESKPEKNAWPQWLGEDVADVGVWSLGYAVSSSTWKGSTMPLIDRASNVLDQLDLEGIGERPVIFVCHSLGGLLVKQMLHHAHNFGKAEYQRIAGQTRAIVFLSTPHSGSNIANWMKYVGTILRASVSVEELEAHHPQLRSLNTWFLNHPQTPQIKILVYCEKKPWAGLLVVDEDSANPGIKGVFPIPMDEDHISICKPKDRNSQIYRGVKKLVEEIARRQLSVASTAPLIRRKPDSEFQRIIRQNIQEILGQRANLSNVLQAKAREILSNGDADPLAALCRAEPVAAIDDVLRPATEQCLSALALNSAEYADTWEAAKSILGWLSLFAVSPEWIEEQENNNKLQGLGFDIVVKTPCGVEIVSSRYRQIPPNFRAELGKPDVYGGDRIAFPLEAGWDDVYALDKLLLEIWNMVFPNATRASALADDDLAQLNSTLKNREKHKTNHYYIPVKENDGSRLNRQDFCAMLLEKLPAITVIHLKLSGGPTTLQVDNEFDFMAVICEFLIRHARHQ